ncbi:MAG: hypothetical protein DWQ34_01810 [Planctomycetota bacterium]|nr:MAG: hypothetical protein DWQ34_01810 [Planctomycetota bacterium]REK26926.1 MAG: hypothetical protein DWQ41_08800 [Planctomycetota bacterium]REK35415.1 MAG: hypothetical protein DWQ45_11915 [Planctomycetota bacterium]
MVESTERETARWFHVTLGTYGSWLPGDPRGFRTRKHRLHVDGDYKNPPPPGKFDEMHARSRQLMNYPATKLAMPERRTVGDALRERFDQLTCAVRCLAVSAQHAHVLTKLPPPETETYVGHAKRHAWYALRDASRSVKLWAKRARIDPVKNDAHLIAAHRYILRHADQGAYVWENTAYALGE